MRRARSRVSVSRQRIFRQRCVSRWRCLSGWHIQRLKNEIDKRIVFLRGQDDQREPAERETSRRLRPRHFLAPIPSLSPEPNNDSRGQNRQNVIGLVNQTANQRRIWKRLIEVKHRTEVLNGAA